VCNFVTVLVITTFIRYLMYRSNDKISSSFYGASVSLNVLYTQENVVAVTLQFLNDAFLISKKK